MSDRKRKRGEEDISKRKREEREGLADTILENSVLVMKSCTYCEAQGHECIASEEDSRRCLHCVKNQKSYCEAFGLTPQQMRKVAGHHSKLNKELEEAEEEWLAAGARVKRLRTQKREWSKKMERAIARGIDNLEELERVEKEEREEREAAEAARQAATSQPDSSGADPAFSLAEPVDFLEDLDPLLVEEFLGRGGVFPQESLHSQGSQ